MLERLFLLSCFFPFVSPFPINSDVQPLAGIFAIFVLFKHNYLLKKPIPMDLFFIFGFSIFLLTYNNPLSNIFDPDYGKMFSLVFGILIIMAFQFSKHSLNTRFLNYTIGIYFIYTVLLLLNPSFFINIQNMVIRNTNSVDFTYRGVSTLSTEPGLFGGLLIFFLLIIDNTYNKLKINKINMYLLKALVIIMLILTKSGTGYLYFIIYILLNLIFSQNKKIKKYLLFLISGIVFIAIFSISLPEFSTLGRGASILYQLSNPIELAQADTSIFSRLVSISLAFFSLFKFPFGVGSGNVALSANELMLDTPYLFSYFKGGVVGFNSSFSYLAVSYGLLFGILFLFIYLKYSKTSFINKFFSATFFIVSYSSAFPAIWVLLSLKDRK
jgi:hypothetical protein